MSQQKRVMLISYLFPPAGGAGVQRNVKYGKYLSDFGWRTYVLTVKDILYHVYDESLLEDLAADTHIIRTGSLDPLRLCGLLRRRRRAPVATGGGKASSTVATSLARVYRTARAWLAFPDASLGWLPFAYAAGLQAVRDHRINVIVASVAPYTSAVLARLIAARADLPYVLDFRDGWIDYPYLEQPTRLHTWGHSRLERKTIQDAAEICVYGPYLRDRLTERYPQTQGRVHVITNGFDPSDCKGVEPMPKQGGRRRVVYSGGLYERYSGQFSALLNSLKMLPRHILEQLEFVFVGKSDVKEAEQQVASAGLQEHVRLVGYVPHRDALRYVLSADACLLFLPPGDRQAYSGKVFEYLMSGVPIMASLEMDGTGADLLRSVGQERWMSPPGDASAMCSVIEELVQSGWPKVRQDEIGQFSRPYLAGRLAGVLDKAVAAQQKTR